MDWYAQPIGAVSAPTELRDPRNQPDAEFRYIDIAGIDRVQKKIANYQTLRGANAPSRARKVVHKDDVLVATVRPNLNAVAMVPDELHGEIASTGFCVLRANRTVVDPRYLFYSTVSTAFVVALTAKVRGANYPAVSDGDVTAVEIPLPPPSEQCRIVEILDQADRIRHFRAEADAKADRILQALFTRILGSPTNWPGDSRSRRLGELVDLVSGATPSKANAEYWDGEVPWVSPKDMKQDFLSDSQDHISETALNETNLKLIDPGNVLIVVRGMILARDVPVALNLERVTINQDMKALVPKTDEVTGSFLWATLRLAKTSMQALVRTAAHGTRKLDTPELMQFEVVVPSGKQRAQVRNAVDEHRQLLQGRANSGAKIGRLFAILLNRAFSGDLTASWREAHMKELLQEMEQQARALARV